ncbi:MAG: 3-phosphoshikimate 1-carboxyvinyltransferase [Gammaproteobacteria bacterium]|nr:3-phosphoshikimate 1-carboxyvinyltransferase [Gammaproteobacteria bacterium]
MSASVTYRAAPGGRLGGRVRVPGDKSISHRSIMLGALAEGVTDVSGFLEGEDCLATLEAFRIMGVKIERPEPERVVIHGAGMRGLRTPHKPLDLGNSGTSMRLLCGLLAGQPFSATLIGDASLSRRPMKRVIEPLTRMGARIEASPDGTAPLIIHGNTELRGIDYVMPVASAQVKSALLLAGLYAQGRTCVSEPAPTRDHTERMLQGFGYPIARHGNTVCVQGGGKLRAMRIRVPADISSAAFFMVGASIAEGSDIVLEHVGVNPTRIGVINILRLMGANIELLNERTAGGEPVADVRVRSVRLHGVFIPAEQVPLAIDEFPALFIAAACAEGETVLQGAHELRVKESDRIQVMADGLDTLGIAARATPDGMVIQGGALSGGEVDSHGDHRIAMAFAMAALRAGAPVTIRDCANVNTSFPGFAGRARSAGLGIQQV